MGKVKFVCLECGKVFSAAMKKAAECTCPKCKSWKLELAAVPAGSQLKAHKNF
jgi:DNA-directed RNA polymerase subunit RPC12/RpoP